MRFAARQIRPRYELLDFPREGDVLQKRGLYPDRLAQHTCRRRCTGHNRVPSVEKSVVVLRGLFSGELVMLPTSSHRRAGTWRAISSRSQLMHRRKQRQSIAGFRFLARRHISLAGVSRTERAGLREQHQQHRGYLAPPDDEHFQPLITLKHVFNDKSRFGMTQSGFLTHH